MEFTEEIKSLIIPLGKEINKIIVDWSNPDIHPDRHKMKFLPSESQLQLLFWELGSNLFVFREEKYKLYDSDIELQKIISKSDFKIIIQGTIDIGLNEHKIPPDSLILDVEKLNKILEMTK